MPLFATIRASLYKDSVALMRVAEQALALPGVRQATLLMGTPANKAMLTEAGLAHAALDAARPGDLMIVVDADTSQAGAAATAECLRLLDGTAPRAAKGSEDLVPRSIATAAGGVTLAQISVPGPYAAAEAMKALRRGLDVFLFSDNVPLAHERALKQIARAKGRLVLGPDCGTAIIGGTPVGFANAVRGGTISLVGASGTGLQEVTCRIDALGEGVRHAIGTGGRDVSDEIGGITLHDALDLLASDAGTEVIVIVSKPPGRDVARCTLDKLRVIAKPVVVLFLGGDASGGTLPERVVVVETLQDAAAAAVALLRQRRFEARIHDPDLARVADDASRALATGQRYLRGLYSGGTFCTEAQLVWRNLGLHVRSNAPVDARVAGSDGEGHVALDLGSDEYTVGRPHPMIDPATRIARIAEAARDPSTAVIVLDLVLGYAAHADPAGALAPAITAARATCADEGRELVVVAFVCGTEADPQRLSAQQAALRNAGVLVASGSTAAARLAGEIALRAQARASRSLAAEGWR